MKSSIYYRPILMSLFAFLFAAGLGLAMRWAFVVNMPEWFNYKNIQHAHSHVALLGWLFGIFYLGIVYFFDFDLSKYIRLYWMLQTAVIGMLLTFPIVGYASFSIAFSTLHILLTYLFVYKIWKDFKGLDRKGLHILFVKTSLIFMVLSTVGTWALGPIMALKMKGGALYYGAIQFYLHFQFNGWFVFAFFGIGLALLMKKGIQFDTKKLHQFYKLLLLSTLMTFALAITWSTPQLSIFIINSLGVIVQMLAFILLLQLLKKSKNAIKEKLSNSIYQLFLIAIYALIFKVAIQTMVAVPYLAEVSYTIRNFIIGFIHLLMLGCLSLFGFGMISEMTDVRLSKVGMGTFLGGVVLTEVLLFLQGLRFWIGLGFIPGYYIAIAVASAFIFIGLIGIVFKWSRFRD